MRRVGRLFRDAGCVAESYAWSGGRLRRLGPGLRLPREASGYREVPVSDAHL